MSTNIDTEVKSTKGTGAPRIIISMNGVITNDPCALCGARTNPNGIDLMLADEPALVCRDCGLAHARPLAMLLGLADAAYGFANAHEDAF